MGQPVAKRTLLNRSETFLFTIYEVVGADWIRPVTRGGSISVAMLGGIVQAGDRVLSATTPHTLSNDGTAVLLFLTRIPGAPKLFAGNRPIRIVNGAIPAAEFPEAASITASNGSIPLDVLLTVLRGHHLKCAAPR